MLNQQHPLLNTIDSYIEPLLKRVLQTKRLGICYGLIKLDSASSSCNKSKNDCFKLLIPYAGEHLVWNVLFDSQYPEMGPDFIFNDQNFLADPDIDILSTKVPSLAKWNPNDTDALLNVLNELLLYYKEHQLHLLGKQERLQFEYSTLVGETEILTEDIEVMMLPLGTKPTETKFLIRIAMDYSQLPPRINKSQNDEAMLIITFCGPDWNRILPQLYLSKTLEDIFGGPESLRIPPFPPNKYLMDYVPEVKKFIQEKMHNVIQSFESRRSFITVLIVSQRGSILEYDAIEFNWISMLMEYRDFHFLIHFHLPSTFPKEKPQVTLQSVYHMTSQGTLYKEVLDDIPYSPRWQIVLMVDKLLTYILENAVKKFQANSMKNRFQ
ncbi:BRISC and BRCA1-A complex member 2-like [Cataglyphis hispanica]|uniref:BRISC and BRCA1-A complex member 2-like n=1 Tax=Cataglyphis hispanica TaxID=1086592 RepID=UPI0021804B63|nr:BRISC and BRCA1-A complex member 2-like [Cataglyphis hispanica]XP_050445515.1 BRISC and BRCA1-A complex member 2-like [Cataglyphis hispanica]XP_050445516.1 BRISC and BRCA1-A complex member 2-like [Cataglyphis hispanica]XP_050445517.1 BRISC and BRCA1-A complex member 2-like [Cataglyphis hispanica]